MFRLRKKHQSRVEISFKHGSMDRPELPREVIEIPLGQKFDQCIGADRLWEGSTLIKEYDWVAGYTRVYEYFYDRR